MAKYLNKKQKKKHGFGWFLLGMFLYAAVMFAAAAFGLKYLWNFLEAYEISRPQVALDVYMENLTEEHICDLGMAVTNQIDQNLQSEEQCREVILESVSGGIQYAKKSKESTQTRQFYVLHCGKQVIGEFSIVAGAADDYGFTPWSLESESFDFSFLIGQKQSVTVPYDCQVTANGHVLGKEYITEDKIQYEEIRDYYAEYDLPYKVTYEAGPILGELKLDIADAAGNAVTFDATTDWSVYYHNCSEQETKTLDKFTADFVERYVAFTGSNKNTRHGTHKRLMEYVDPSSNLASRLKNAIEGLQFGQSKGDKIVSLTAHHQLKLEEGKYLCDITYEVDTTGKKGVVRTSTNAKLTILETPNGLKVESMLIY